MKNYTGRFTNRLTLRLSDEKYNYILDLAESYGMSPSKVIRLLIDESYYSAQAMERKVCSENRTADCND